MRPVFLLLLLVFASVGRLSAGPLDFWTCNLVLTNATVIDAIFANGKFVVGVSGASGGRSSILVSDDGGNWREAREGSIGSLCQGNGVIVGTDGSAILSSSDGVSWIARRPFFVSQTRQLLFGQGRFVAQVGNGTGDNPIALWSSPDGIEWSVVSTSLWPESFVRAQFWPRLAFVKDRWTTLDRDPDLLPVPMQSFDGLHFTPNPEWPVLDNVQYNGWAWVGGPVTNLSTVAVSRDGIRWTLHAPNPNWQAGNVFRLTTYAGRFFACGSKNFFFESLDGERWTDHQVDLLTSTKWDGWLNMAAPILAGNNRAVAVAQVYTPATNSIGQGKRPVIRFYVSQPLTNGVAPMLGMSSLPALKLESGTIGGGYHIESATSVIGPWERVATVFPTHFPFTFLAPIGEQQNRIYRAVVRD